MQVPCLRKLSDTFLDNCQEPVTVHVVSQTAKTGYYCWKCAKLLFGIEAPREPLDFQPKKEK